MACPDFLEDSYLFSFVFLKVKMYFRYFIIPQGIVFTRSKYSNRAHDYPYSEKDVIRNTPSFEKDFGLVAAYSLCLHNTSRNNSYTGNRSVPRSDP